MARAVLKRGGQDENLWSWKILFEGWRVAVRKRRNSRQHPCFLEADTGKEEASGVEASGRGGSMQSLLSMGSRRSQRSGDSKNSRHSPARLLSLL